MAQIAGRRLGPYEVLSALGEGGMGEVYRSRDTRLGRVVALKILPGRLAADPGARARFEREARLASSLNHPNIVVVHDIGEAGGVPYIAMECVEGDTLGARLRHGSLAIATAVEIAAQIADALARAHAAGVIHRDLKPSNVMLTPDGRVKVLDFGLGKQTGAGAGDQTTWSGNVTTPGVVMGTASYMSPEQAQGRASDWRSDQFALGLMLYEMLAGRHPFERPSAVQTMAAIIGDEAPLIASSNAKVPEALALVLDRCLSKDPNGRFDSTADLARAIQDIGDHLRSGRPLAPVSARHVPRWAPPLSIAASVATALVVGTLVWVATHGGMTLPGNRQIAVLPFANVGGGPETQALGDGLVEVLTTRLTQMERFTGGLLVVPANEVRAQRVDSPGGARRSFGVNLVVTGSVQRSNGRLLLTVNLVDAASLRQLRADAIDVPLSDATALQDDVLLRLARLLDLDLPPAARAEVLAGGTRAPGAFEYYLQGRGYLQRYERAENIDLALALFDRATAADPSYALAFAARAEAELRRYEAARDAAALERARAAAARAGALAPHLAAVRLTSAMIATTTGRYEDAVATLQSVLADDPTSADALRELGRAFEAVGDMARAEGAFKQAVAARPNDWSAYNHLGAFYSRRRRWSDAAEQFSRVLELTPDNARGHSNLGGMQVLLGEVDAAIASFEHATAINPAYATAWSNLGTLYFRQSRDADAVRALEQASALGPKNHQVWFNLASAASRLAGRDAQAREAYARAAEFGELDRQINPRQPMLLARLASCYANLDDGARARSLLREAEALAPGDAGLLLLAAEVYEELGDRQRALARVEAALKHGLAHSELEANRSLEGLRKDPAFPRLLPSGSRLRQRPRRQRRTGGHEHVLPAVDHVGRRGRAVQRRTHLIPPQQLAAPRVQRDEVALGVPGEDQAGRRGQQARR
jgi:serine/threonine-protein kinase